MQEGHGDRLVAAVAYQRGDPASVGFVESGVDGAVVHEALRHLEGVAPFHQAGRVAVEDVVVPLPGGPSQQVHVPKPRSGHYGRSGAGAGQESVEAQGGAVGEQGCAGQGCADPGDRVNHTQGRVLRRRGNLLEPDLPAVVETNHVRERSPHVDSQAVGSHRPSSPRPGAWQVAVATSPSASERSMDVRIMGPPTFPI